MKTKYAYLYICFFCLLAVFVLVCVKDDGDIPMRPDYHCAYCEEKSLKIDDKFCGTEQECKDWIYWVGMTQKPHGKTIWKCKIK